MDRRLDNVPRAVFDRGRSARQKYQDLVIGRPGWIALARHELVMHAASRTPGALGLKLRALLYPTLLGACGRNVFFGTHVTLRHPHKIRLGDNVVIDDGCVLDAKGVKNAGIAIGNGVFIGRQSMIYTKDGDIELEDGVNVGAFCSIFSASHVRLSKNTLVAAYAYLVGGGHEFTRTDEAIVNQPRPSAGILIGANCWIGAGVTVLDGVTIGREVVVGANSVVTRDLDDYAIAAGSPAAVLRHRGEARASSVP